MSILKAIWFHGIINGYFKVTMKKKFKIQTLGCRTNQYESQAYHDQLKQLGFVEGKSDEKADVCIVNTCTVTESADKSSRYKIRSLLKENPGAKVFVTGCMVENERKALEAMDPNIKIVSNLEKENLLSHIFPDVEDLPEFQIKEFDVRTRAFVKVQDGCNSFCTYCVIPYVRGRSRSKKEEEIIKEIHELVKNGYQEIVLTGINIGDYDGAAVPKKRLSDLIRLVDKIDGVKRIRVSSIDPDEVDDDLADAILNCEKTCPSMHIVLQSGSNVILKRMNRKYTKQMFFDTVEKMTQANPDFTVTTDIIVGFPGETESDFQDSLDVVKKVKFSKVHMFPYSARPRTRSALYKDPVPLEVIQKRKQEMLREAERAAFSLREQFIGREFDVLLEADDDMHDDYISGYTSNFLRVRIPKKGLSQNQIVRVKLLENASDALLGKVL
jgi:threonylcarbamoyladenosine tRNA methylthiotransferase MtaB